MYSNVNIYLSVLQYTCSDAAWASQSACSATATCFQLEAEVG